MVRRSPPTDAELLDRQPVLAGQQREGGREARRGRHDEARRALAEQLDGRRVGHGDPDVRPEAAPDRGLREGDRETAARHVLGARDEAARDGLADERLESGLARRGRAPAARPPRPRRPAPRRRSRRARPWPRRRAGPCRGRAGTPVRRAVSMSSSRPTTPISGVGRDGPRWRLVVERDVATGDGQAQGPAGVAQAADALLELPEGLRAGRVAVVEAVRDSERAGAR